VLVRRSESFDPFERGETGLFVSNLYIALREANLL
jgi:hypothetical protein